MKLPDDPKERNQLMILIGVFGLAAVYGLYMGVSTLLLKPQKAKEKEISSLTSKLTKADNDIDMMPMLEANNLKHISAIKEISDQCVLHPQLGNFLIPAEQFIRKQEAAAKAIVLEVKEIGINNFPDPEPPARVAGDPAPVKKQWSFKIYTARVEVGGGFHNAIKLAKQIEAANPFICISSIKMTPEEETPFQHNMTFDVQWPIWNPNRTTAGILEILNSPASRQSIDATQVNAPATKPKATVEKAAVETDNSAASAGLDKLGVNVDEK